MLLSEISKARVSSKFRSGLNVAAPASPNQKVIREIALDNRELLKMLATNGRYKPKTDSPKSSAD
jgi:hypothetical protein